MALNFPNSPTANQIYTDSTTGNRYLWDATNKVWRWTPNTISLVVQSLAPGSPSSGQLWWNADLGRMFVYYNDGDSSQWVETNPVPDVYAITNSAIQSYAVSANNWANTKLSNTNVTLAGNLTVTGAVIATALEGYGMGFANANLITGVGYTIWTIPSGVQRFKVTLIGGGGGGGGTNVTAGATGSGGGSSGVCIGFFNYVSGVDSLYCNVGRAGLVTSSNGAGANGSSSNVTYNDVWMFANGGFGGANNQVLPTLGFIGGAAGTASGGSINIPGDTGEPGGIASATNPVTGTGAFTPLGWGNGGDLPGSPTGANGSSGSGYGSGGSGARNGAGTTIRAGGSGANGAILIEW